MRQVRQRVLANGSKSISSRASARVPGAMIAANLIASPRRVVPFNYAQTGQCGESAEPLRLGPAVFFFFFFGYLSIFQFYT